MPPFETEILLPQGWTQQHGFYDPWHRPEQFPVLAVHENPFEEIVEGMEDGTWDMKFFKGFFLLYGHNSRGFRTGN